MRALLRGRSARMHLALALRVDTQHACNPASSWEQIVVGMFVHALRARNSRCALRADSVRSAVAGWLGACCLMIKTIIGFFYLEVMYGGLGRGAGLRMAVKSCISAGSRYQQKPAETSRNQQAPAGSRTAGSSSSRQQPAAVTDSSNTQQ